ncbi:MAG: membrane protein insertase YidC [Bryobacterales bacterium]
MPEKDDQFVQQRLLAASVLSGLLVMGYFWFQSRNSLPPLEPQAIEQSAETPAQAAEPAAAAEPSREPSGEPASPEAETPAAAEQTIVVETDTFIATFSNRGAVVTSWVLKNFEDSAGDPLNLVHSEGVQEFGAPFRSARSAARPSPSSTRRCSSSMKAPRTAPRPRRSSFASPTAHAAPSRHSAFPRKATCSISLRATQRMALAQPHLVAWPGGFGDTGHQQDWMFSKTFYEDPSDESIEFTEADDAEDSRITARGLYPSPVSRTTSSPLSSCPRPASR